MKSVVPIHPSADVMPLGRFDLHDLDTMRFLLHGSSVIDWYRLHFKTRAEVDAFLRVNEYDPERNPADRERLRQLQQRAIAYLEEHLRYRIPTTIKETSEVQALFEFASRTRGRRRDRFHACLTLKVMHIINHLDSFELLSMLPISHAEIAVLAHAKVERVVRGFLERGFPIVEFSGNTKSSYSVLTKLLAKKDTQAAQVFDKLRFRIIVERLEDVPPLLLALTRELMPFSYLVPNQSDNTLVDVDGLLARAGNLDAIRALQEDDSDLNEEPTSNVSGVKKNEFSGPDYRAVSFVADIPLRLDRTLSFQNPRLAGLGGVVFTLVEFQVVDRLTAAANEMGENRHSLYKQRQRGKVKERLERGKRRKGSLAATAAAANPEASGDASGAPDAEVSSPGPQPSGVASSDLSLLPGERVRRSS